MPRVSVLGNGGWGNAMAIQALRAGNQTTIWGHNSDYLAECESSRTNPKYLAGLSIPKELRYQPNLSLAVEDADIILVAIPTAHLRSVLADVPHDSKGIWLSLTKGIEHGTLSLPSEIIREVTGLAEVGILSGPNIAGEVARGLPASAVVAHPSGAILAQEALSSEHFRPYRSNDLIGVELGGVIKNVLAIAAGMIDGMGLGDNAKAVMLVRGMKELTRLGVAIGAEEKTFSGLSGAGDLFVTCTSPHGRNRSFGERLGKGLKIENALESGGKVVEGYHSAKSVRILAEKFGVELPICQAIHDVLYEGITPHQAVRDLMTREVSVE